MAVQPIFQNILDAHFGGSMQKQLNDLWPPPERPLDPPEDKNADRLAAIQDCIDDLRNEIEELEREYEYIASGDEEEDLRAEAMERMYDNELAGQDGERYMGINVVFQEILNAHYPPRWVRELDEIPGPPPTDMTDAEYNPYVKEGEIDAAV